MAGGREYSRHQKGVIRRYYEHRDTIVGQRLGEIVSELYLAAGDEKKSARLWKRAEDALAKTKLNPALVRKTLDSRDLESLARLVADVSG